MLKKFTEGLLFGGGFAISFIALWYIGAYLIFPTFMSGATILPSSLPIAETLREPTMPFHELGLEEQIKKSSVIALAKYEVASDGKMRAIIKEFLKKEPGTTIYYNIGDEHSSSSYYPKAKTNYGDGMVIFFTGSPATMKMSTSYSGDRIHGLADLPVELLRKKCKGPAA